jgi:hypothetical protein
MTDITISNGRAVTNGAAKIKWLTVKRQMEGAVRLSKTGEVSFDASGHNLDIWKKTFPDCQVTDTAAFEEFVTTEKRPEFSFKREPLPHQNHAFEKFKAKNISAIFGAVGSGKSKILSDLAAYYWCAGQIDAVIVVSLNFLIASQWHEKQLERDVAIPFVSWLWKQSKKAKEEYATFTKSETLQFLNINIDALRTEKGFALCDEFIKRHKGRVFFVVDEAQAIKTPNAQRTKKTIELALKCNHRSISTGTPISKNLIDLWTEFKALDERIIGIRYITAFKRKYCELKFNGFADEIIGYKNQDEFYARTEPYTFRISKEELGFRDFDDEFDFKLGERERKHYNEFKKQFLTKLDSGEISSVSIALSAMIRMQQVSNGFLVGDDGTVEILECSRLAALKDFLESVDDDKIVIWARFKKDSELITKALDAVDISGNIDSSIRYQNVQTFISDKSKRFCVGTPKASGVGTDGLQTVTNRSVFYSNSEHALDYWQARARTSRIGGNSFAFYTHLIGKGTVDRKILANLTKKEELSTYMLDTLRRMFDE